MSDAEAETFEETEVLEAPVRKARARKAKEAPAPPEPAAPPVRKSQGRKAKEESTPPEPAAAPEAPRRRKVRVEIPQPDTPPPRRTRKAAEPAIDTSLGPEFWGRMLDAHRQQTETSRNEHYASFRIIS